MTTPPSALPPANWYPDPQTPSQLRYWDGQRWTQHVHPVEKPAQATGGFAAQEPQVAGDPTTQATQSQAGAYTPVIQANPVTTARPHAMPGVQAAGPATGGTLVPGAHSMAGGAFPATGATAVQPSATAGSPGMLQAPKPRDFDDDSGADGPTPTAPLAAISVILGVAAIGVAVLAIFGLGTDYDEYFPYAGAGLGFLAVLFGFLGRKRAVAGFMGGALFAWAGIIAGFLAMLLSTYEYLYPGELYTIYNDYLG